jgi:hypothetical protein
MMKSQMVLVCGCLAVLALAALSGSAIPARPSAKELELTRILQEEAHRKQENARNLLAMEQALEAAKTGPGFQPIRLMGRTSPIVRPKVIPAAEAKDQVLDGDSVIGVVVGGEARAYPINMMASPKQELLNDTLGGDEIAVTWCGMCEIGIVFDRRVDDRTLSFFLPGSIWRENMVMEDSETKSQWSQALGKAMQGPLADHKLKVVPSVVTDWASWKKSHPETTLLDLPLMADEYVQDYSYDATKTGPDQFLLVMELGGETRAWPLESLTGEFAINDAVGGDSVLVLFDNQNFTADLYFRKLGERNLKFRCESGKIVDEETGSVWDAATGQAMEGPLLGQHLSRAPGFLILREKWLNLRPETSVWTPAVPTNHVAS